MNFNELTTKNTWEYTGGSLIVPSHEDNLLQHFSDPNFAVSLGLEFTDQSNFTFLNLKYIDDWNRVVLMMQTGSKYPVVFKVRDGQWQPNNKAWKNPITKPEDYTFGWRWLGNTVFIYRNDYVDDVIAHILDDSHLVAGLQAGVASGPDRYAKITHFIGGTINGNR